MRLRVISGLVMGLLVILMALYLPTIWTWPLLVGIAALAQFEFYSMVNAAGIPTFRFLGVILGTILISTTFCGISIPDSWATLYFWEQAVLFLTLIAVFLRQFPQKHNPKPLETIACTLFGVWYVPFLLNFFTRLAFEWDQSPTGSCLGPTGRLLLLYCVIVVKSSDVGAFLVGRTFGRHKLFPRLSPAKTYEGLAGGILFSVLVSLGFWYATGGALGRVPLTFYDAIWLGALLAVSGTVGDLFESLVKRAASIKDSGRTVPGMGGLLDVLDSLLFGVPMLYLYERIFAG